MVDTSRAEKLPAAKETVTAKEAGLIRYRVSPARYDETVFCHKKVRYVGDHIAAVTIIGFETALFASPAQDGRYKLSVWLHDIENPQTDLTSSFLI